MSKTIQLTRENPGTAAQVRDADLVIDAAGVVIKDRDGETGRRATFNELLEATR